MAETIARAGRWCCSPRRRPGTATASCVSARRISRRSGRRRRPATGAAFIQPVYLHYSRLTGLPMARLERPGIAWYGDMTFLPHLFGYVGGGGVTCDVYCGEPIRGHPGPPPQDARAPDRGGGRRLAQKPPPGRCRLFCRAGKGLRKGIVPGDPSLSESNVLETRAAPRRGTPAPARVHQVVRLPDERLRLPAHGRPGRGRGLREAASVEDADLIVLNTCHIRERASEKIYSELGKLRELKDERAGAGATDDDRRRRLRRPGRGRARSCAASPRSTSSSVRRATTACPSSCARRGAGGVVDTEFPAEDKFAHLPAARPTPSRARGVSAFVTVQEGCDKFCSFCVVPYTRGAEASRPSPDPRRDRAARRGRRARGHADRPERQRLARARARRRRVGLAGLIARAARGSRRARVRYATSHPNDMTDDLIAAHARIAALAPYLHLPVQSGSDRILASMNRRHSAADYLAVVARVRAARPDIALSSDFIVGYPGETDADFEATLALVREVGFASSYAFKYSRAAGNACRRDGRPGCRSGEGARLAALQALLEEQRQAFNRAKRRAAPRRSVREARPARGPAHRTFALHAGGVRRGGADPDRRSWPRSRSWPSGRIRCGAHCLASVANAGFDARAG